MSQKGILGRKVKIKRISPEAKKLIVGILRRCKGSERQAAKILRLANHAQLGRMLRGEMAETPAMRAAVLRAKSRADAAFCMRKMEVPQVDLIRARKLIADAKWLIEVLENML